MVKENTGKLNKGLEGKEKLLPEVPLKTHCLILYYQKHNQFSFNPLLSALENSTLLEKLEVFLAWNEQKLFHFLQNQGHAFENIFIAFSFFSQERPEILALINRLQTTFALPFIFIGGGPDASGEPRKLIESGFNYIVKGEGEVTLISLLKNLLNSNGPLADKVLRGVFYRNGDGKVHYRPSNHFVNLDDYFSISEHFKRFGAIEISRGCAYYCHFCQTPNFHGGKLVRHRSPENIAAQIEIMIRNGKYDLHFISPNALTYGSPDGKTVDLDKLSGLLEKVRLAAGTKGIVNFGSFPSEVRPEHISENSLRLLREYAHSRRLNIGAQSGSAKFLKKINRSHSVAEILHCVHLSLKMGFEPHVDFLFGIPGEDEEDVIASITVMQEIIKSGGHIRAHTFMPLPQTRFKRQKCPPLSRHLRHELHKLKETKQLKGFWQVQEKVRMLNN